MKLCVSCGAKTTEQVHEHTTADVCPDGHGLWLDQRELLSAVRTVSDGTSIGNSYEEGRSLRLAADRDIEAGDEERACPMCSKAMGSVRYGLTSDVVVDVCATHGVWLDAGELEELEAWAEQRADPSSAESQARAARRALRASKQTEFVETRMPLMAAIKAMLSGRG